MQGIGPKVIYSIVSKVDSPDNGVIFHDDHVFDVVLLLFDRYPRGLLVEINSHSLFSKWFSESGKLVMKMFQKIDEFMNDEESLICLLIGKQHDPCFRL